MFGSTLNGVGGMRESMSCMAVGVGIAVAVVVAAPVDAIVFG